MAPAAAPTPVPMSAPLPAPYPVPAPTAAPAAAPTPAPVTVPQPVLTMPSNASPMAAAFQPFVLICAPPSIDAGLFIGRVSPSVIRCSPTHFPARPFGPPAAASLPLSRGTP